MAPKLPSLKRIYRAAERERTLEGVTASKLRLLLKEREGWECADDEWKKGGLKQEAAAQWEELVVRPAHLALRPCRTRRELTPTSPLAPRSLLSERQRR